MAEDIKRIDYTTKDYEAYRQDMIDEIPNKLPEWTDRSDADPGIVILELLAMQLERLSYYNDRVANEALFPTATRRQSVMKHLKLIDYEMAWHTPAKHWQVFRIEPQLTDTIIPKGFQVGTVASDSEEAIIFETLTDLVIPAGATGIEQDGEGNYLYQVEVEHGQTILDEFIGEVNTNDPSPSFKLTYSPVYRPSIEIMVEDYNGKYTWTAVNDFISSTQEDNHYISEMTEYEEVIIRFGNGTSGKVPIAVSNIFANYKVGGGTEGNVGANTIVELYEAVPGLEETFNPFGPHVLGKNMESVEEAKWRGPASLKTLNRYVTIPDYEDGIRLDYPAVAKAKGIANTTTGDVDLYLAPFVGDTLSASQKAEIMEIINEKQIIFASAVIKDPIYKTVNVSVDVIIHDNYDAEMIRYSAENIIRDLFDPENMDFGKDVTLSEIHFEIRKTAGVRNVIISAPVADTVVADNEIAKLGTLTVLVNGK